MNSSILFTVTVEAVSYNGNLGELWCAPIGPQKVIVHGLATMGHEEQGLFLHRVFAELREQEGKHRDCVPVGSTPP